MAQTELGGYQSTVDPRKDVQELWRLQASANVDEHPMLCAIDECVVDSVNAAIRNTQPLTDWDVYREGI